MNENEFDSEEELNPRTAQEVAARIVALRAVVRSAHGGEINEWIQTHSIRNLLSIEEMAFLDSTERDERTSLNMSWRAECFASLFWALGELEAMPPLSAPLSDESIPKRLFDELISSPKSFIASAKLRPESELIEMENSLYEQHWRVNDARLRGGPMPPRSQFECSCRKTLRDELDCGLWR
jgi:Domain of unknown function (DUF4272)